MHPKVFLYGVGVYHVPTELVHVNRMSRENEGIDISTSGELRP